MADTPWIGSADDKLYLQSGQFSATLKTSLDVNAVESAPTGITFDGTDTPWTGSSGDKLYLQSGQFSATLKTSLSVGGIDIQPSAASWDGTDTPWAGRAALKLYLQSGQFSATLKTSMDMISAYSDGSDGISFDATNTPALFSVVEDKLLVFSGQISATIKTSLDVNGVDTTPTGISWDGTDTPWCGNTANKLYLQSGQFSATIKTSLDIGSIDATPQDICTNDVDARITALTDYTLTADGVTYSWSPQDAGFLVDYLLSAGSVSYSWAPQDAGFLVDYALSADAVSYALSWGDVGLTYTPIEVLRGGYSKKSRRTEGLAEYRARQRQIRREDEEFKEVLRLIANELDGLS